VSTLSRTLQDHGHEVLLYGLAVEGLQSNIPREDLLSDIDFKSTFSDPSLRGVFRVISRTVYSNEAKRSMHRMIEKYSPDLVHLNNIHHFLTPSIVWPIVAKKIPVVWTLHDYTIICPNTTMRSNGSICESCISGRFYHCVIKKCKRGSLVASGLAAAEAYCHHIMKAYDKVSQFIAPSAFLRAKFLEAGFSESSVTHIPNPIAGVLLSTQQMGEGHGMFIGRLSEEKGLWTLVRALGGLPNTAFDIIGDGPLRPALEDFCRVRSLHGIRFHGKVESAKVKEAVHNCKFVVVPSEWYENCPYAVLEAMQAGKPVIASAIGGLPELIQDRRNGMLCTSGDVAAFREAIATLDADVGLRARLGEEGARIVNHEYDTVTHYRRLQDVYSSYVGPS
jgi:glycosyltransferase involved in cell wall biosynthesis